MSLATDFWPRKGNGVILVTSRNARVAHGLPADHVAAFRIESFPSSEGVQFFVERSGITGQDFDHKIVEAIVSKFYGLPLILRQIAEYFKEGKLTLSGLWDRFNEPASSLEFAKHKDTTSEYKQSLHTAWLTVLEPLAPENLELLDVLAFLDPDGVDHGLFSATKSLQALPDWADGLR